MGFWDKKFADQGPTPQPRPVTRAPFGPSLLPRGTGQDHDRAVAHYLQRQQEQSVQQQQEQNLPPEDVIGETVSETLWKWRGNPKGGKQDTEALGRCPNCDSNRYFSRQFDEAGRPAGLIRSDGVRIPPMPECTDCGYPRMHNSDSSSSIAKVTGSPSKSRQPNQAAISPPGNGYFAVAGWSGR